MNRRDLLQAIGALLPSAAAMTTAVASQATAKTTAPKSSMGEAFVGIQLGSHSVFDEGADACLDLLQATAGVNAVFVYTHFYQGLDRHPEDFAADHGLDPETAAKRDLPKLWVRVRDKAYHGPVKHVGGATQAHQVGGDVLAALEKPAAARRVRVYARILEAYGKDLIDLLSGWKHVQSTDLFGKPSALPCWNRPAYKAYWQDTIDDLFSSYELAGLKWGSERSGPLSNLIMNHPWIDPVPTCFCADCGRQAKRDGIDMIEAKRGFAALYEILGYGPKGTQPLPSGMAVEIMRTLLRYPAVLDWERAWHTSRERLATSVHNAIKRQQPHAEFGRHVWQTMSFDPLYRAAFDYRTLLGHTDWVKPALYNGRGGARLKAWVLDQMAPRAGRDIPLERLVPLFYDVLGYDAANEPAAGKLSSGRFSSDYVEREIKRARGEMGANSPPIYAGLGFDLPHEPKPTPAHQVNEAVSAALRAGASGILISREYDEITVPTLKAIGGALKSA